MKNITVSVDEELYRLSRVKAAEAGTSVAALVRSYLVELVQGQTASPASTACVNFKTRRWPLSVPVVVACVPLTTFRAASCTSAMRFVGAR